MTRALKVLAAIGAVAMVAAGSAEAAGVNQRERWQRERIQHNVRAGELTFRETARLSVEQARIRREEYRYRHDDGHIGPWERARIQRDLNQASRHIAAQSHDAQGR